MPTILCFGDFNTHGTAPMAGPDDVRRFGPAERWPGVVAATLGQDWRVIEEGLPGRTTVHADPIEGAHMNGLAALPILAGSHAPLDVVVLKLGTNDLKERHSVGAGDIARSVELLVVTLRQLCTGPGRTVPAVLIVAPPPILEAGWLADMFQGGRQKSLGLAAALRASAGRLGAAFLDAADHIAVSPVDGIHYDAAAHGTLGLAIATAVRDLAAAPRA